MTRYRTIVVDPPWEIGDFPPNFGYQNGKPRPYSTMTLDEIKALPVRDLSDNNGCDAHLYLWTIDSFLRDAFDVARGWGFQHSATIVWCKPRFGKGLGGIWPSNVEFVLFCRRPAYDDRHGSLVVTRWLRAQLKASGMTRNDLATRGEWSEGQLVHWLAGTEAVGPGVPTMEVWLRIKRIVGFGDDMDDLVQQINAAKGTSTRTSLERTSGRWFEWPRGPHSAKPEAFLDLVEQVSPGPYVELFARRARFGWDYWGDESLGTVELPAA